MHQTVHVLAQKLRNLDLYYQQYVRYQAVRAAARVNLDQQMARYNLGITPFITALQAIVDWGNAVSSEAQSLTLYNTELANLERETGTILEAHNVTFYEERFGSLGPLGSLGPIHCYPRATRPVTDVDRYPTGTVPSEDAFDLRDPLEQRQHRPENLPAPQPTAIRWQPDSVDEKSSLPLPAPPAPRVSATSETPALRRFPPDAF